MIIMEEALYTCRFPRSWRDCTARGSPRVNQEAEGTGKSQGQSQGKNLYCQRCLTSKAPEWKAVVCMGCILERREILGFLKPECALQLKCPFHTSPGSRVYQLKERSVIR